MGYMGSFENVKFICWSQEKLPDNVGSFDPGKKKKRIEKEHPRDALESPLKCSSSDCIGSRYLNSEN